MVIYPAIDIKSGKCVRLTQGRFSDVTVYSGNPVEMAEKWCAAGAEYIHVVDLDGALEGKRVNGDTIRDICRAVSVPVQLGGGMRDLGAIESALELGVSRVILGTAAVRSQELVAEAVRRFPSRIAVGIDAKDGFVAVEGWERVSGFRAVELAKRMEDLGVGTIICTDISTDGTLKGPNLGAMKEMVSSVGMEVIASGGVGSLEDIINLKKTGVAGVIVGRALYTNNLDLKEAIAAAKN